MIWCKCILFLPFYLDLYFHFQQDTHIWLFFLMVRRHQTNVDSQGLFREVLLPIVLTGEWYCCYKALWPPSEAMLGLQQEGREKAGAHCHGAWWPTSCKPANVCRLATDQPTPPSAITASRVLGDSDRRGEGWCLFTGEQQWTGQKIAGVLVAVRNSQCACALTERERRRAVSGPVF